MSLSSFNLENEAAVKISTAHIRKLSAHVATHLSENNLYLFANDNGHTWHKSAYFYTNGNIITQKIPSVVTVPCHIRSIGNKFLDLYIVEGEHFVCNPHATNPIKISRWRHQKSYGNVALVAHALHCSSLLSKPIILGTSLPINRFYKSASINTHLLSVVRKLFFATQKAKILNVSAKLPMRVAECICYPEPFLAYYDWAFGDDGNLRTECIDASGPICIVDIGNSTTSISTITVNAGLKIDLQRSRTVNRGIVNCLNKLNEIFIAEIRISSPTSILSEYQTIDHQLLRKLFVHGSWQVIGLPGTLDLSEQVFKLKNKFVRSIVRTIQRTIGDITGYERIIFTGGGSVVLHQQLNQALPSATFLDEHANARGMLKAMAFIEIKNLIKGAQANQQLNHHLL